MILASQERVAHDENKAYKAEILPSTMRAESLAENKKKIVTFCDDNNNNNSN